MSSEVTAKLPPSVKQVVEAAFGSSSQVTPSDATATNEWLEKIASGSLVKADTLKQLDETLVSKTYLVDPSPTAADVALYALLHPIIDDIAKQSPSTLYSTPSVLRYFNHIQNLQAVRSASGTPAVISLDSLIDAAPKIERKAPEPAKKKGKKDADGQTTEAATATEQKKEVTAIEGNPEPSKDKKEKKEKKEKPKKEATSSEATSSKKGQAASADEFTEITPALIDLRVGKIVDVKKHPDADGLYVEQIDLGEESGPRTIVSGLVKYVPIEQMQDKWLVVVANLKPASMRGVKSYGMVLCATHKDGKESGIEVVDPPQGCKPGDRVYFEGEKYESIQPVSQMNPKKKIWETIQPGFITLDSREAAWIDPTAKTTHRIVTKLGPCTAPTIIGGSLS